MPRANQKATIYDVAARKKKKNVRLHRRRHGRTLVRVLGRAFAKLARLHLEVVVQELKQ
jgi:hypothetical protein